MPNGIFVKRMQVKFVFRNLLGGWGGTSCLKHTSRILLHSFLLGPCFFDK